ncbi:MAG TPA: DHA2 family efflux MFS transporter permease subunit [Fibrobacteria bacterium]|nr:DHA2 family efflux MFS transporter permease subunit [Fibrobacteria bacterium]
MKQAIIAMVPSLHHEHNSYRWWVLLNIMVGTFISSLAGTLVSVALPDIMASTGLSLDTAQWIATAYMVAFAIMLPTSAWLSNRLGYRGTYVLAMSVFTFFSLASGFAWNGKSLIVFRTLQGLGAGLLSPVGMSVVTREFPPSQRGMALGFWMIAAAASMSLGPTFGGYIIDNFGWHATFFVNVPVGVFCILFTLLVQRDYQHASKLSFDFLGFVSMSTFLAFTVVAFSSGNAQWNVGGWTSDFELGCYAAAALSLAIFLATETHVKQPLVNLRLFRRVNFTLSCIALFVVGLGLTGSGFMFPLYLQNSLGYTALQAGMVMLPVGLFQSVFSPLAGVVGDKLSPKIPAVAGLLLLATGYWLNSSLSLQTESPAIFLSLCLRGVGLGIVYTPLMSYAMAGIPRAEIAQASGLSSVVRQLGSSVGAAAFQVLLTSRIAYHTAVYGASMDSSAPQYAAVMRSIGSFVSQAAGGTARDIATRSAYVLQSYVAKSAFVNAVNDDFWIAAVVTASCLVPVLLLRPLDKENGRQ